MYQILLKACSYLDEWDKIFGVKTEPKDKEKILKIKRIARPSYRSISSWKHLREFRNQAIAHNHRDKDDKNIYLNNNTWHSPQSNGEIYLLAYCVKSMTNVMSFYFHDSLKKFTSSERQYQEEKDHQFMKDNEIRQNVIDIDREISENLRTDGAFDELD